MNILEEAELMEQELNKQRMVEILPLAEAAQLKKENAGNKISSGYEELDNCMDGGFREGDFTIISGIPGDGKTTLARMFTLKLAEKGVPSLWFSHEMTLWELWDSFEKMGAEQSLISYVPIELEDDIDWMFTHCDIAIEKYGIKAIFIDTLGDIIKTPKADERQSLNSNYATYLGMICKDLRQYAIKKNVMIIAVAHATKNTRSRTNETDNADIANSNGIPAAATNIFHIWRDPDSDNVSYVKIGKSRRDGTKKGWKFKMEFADNRLGIVGRHETYQGESEYRKY